MPRCDEWGIPPQLFIDTGMLPTIGGEMTALLGMVGKEHLVIATDSRATDDYLFAIEGVVIQISGSEL